MRNATCVGTQTSKVPTRVTLLFIPYTVVLFRKIYFFGKYTLCAVLVSSSSFVQENIFFVLINPLKHSMEVKIAQQTWWTVFEMSI